MLNFYDNWWVRTKSKRPSRVRSTNAAQSLPETPSSTAPTSASAAAAPLEASPTVPPQVPQGAQIHPGWLAPPPAYALPAPGSGVLPHPAVGAAVAKPPDTKTIKVNGELYQKV